ncbi:YbaN family protein [Oxalobacteraceae bacterium R-40]|uniref:YbaN family protein n=1 Tax=Keguizhuia sedimenti TaxID=3064264 RepID=A0ABU1BNF0_9BURK|nr:YbaN family protein [Oxalobacteraceae bacterium R-40]
MKIVLTVIGYVAVALGVLGIFLPLLPTTPFLLLASACFMRSSPRLHQKLMDSPLGGYVRAYSEGHGLPRHVKILMVVLLWASLLYSCTRIDQDMLKILLIVIGGVATILILRIKSSRH